MGSLIYLAAECNIDFYYAISPGLDITYSSPKEVSCLKRKLEQVNDNTIVMDDYTYRILSKTYFLQKPFCNSKCENRFNWHQKYH